MAKETPGLLIFRHQEAKKHLPYIFTDMLTKMQQFMERLFPKHKERIEIKIETKESWEAHKLQKTKIKYCSQCKAETFFVSSDLAQEIVRVNEEKIADLITDGTIHLSDSPERKSLLCLQSVRNKFGEEKPK